MRPLAKKMSKKEAYDIIVLVTNDLTHDRRMLRTCSSLSQRGWRVLFLGRTSKDSIAINVSEFECKRVKCHFNSGAFFYGEILIRFVNVLRKISFRRILCADIDTIGVLRFIKTRDKRVYFDAHELFTEVPELKGQWLKQKIWLSWARWHMTRVDVAWTVGSSLSKILSERYNRSFAVIHNVPWSVKMNQKTTSDSRILSLVYIGVLNPNRGLDLLIAVVRRLSHIRLTIIGGGVEETYLQTLSQECNRIKIVGQVAPEAIYAYLNKSDVGINLLDGTSLNYFYSLANKVFDYFQAGLPVLCMSFPEYIRLADDFDCMYFVDEYSERSIEAALLLIDKHDPQWQKKTREALRARAHFTWEKEAEKLLLLVT